MPGSLPHIPAWNQLRPFIGELWIIVAIVGVLITPFFTKKSNTACALVSLAGLAFGLIGLLTSSSGEAGEYFSGMLIADPLAVFFKSLLLVFTALVVLMWFDTSASEFREGDGPEFFTLLLGATLGMSLMSSAGNLLMIFIALELASLPSYVLAAFRKTDHLGAEASLKYVLFGAATAAVMVYGMSILYGQFGTLSVSEICRQIATTEVSPAPLAIGLIALFVGLAFKIGAVPLHFWCPDVFQGAGMDVAAFLSVASKGAALTLLLRLVHMLAVAMNFEPRQPLIAIGMVIAIIGVLTCTFANAAAFVQQNIKRLLAYSSIAQAGYILCAISQFSTDAVQAMLVYLAVYLFMNLGAFTVAGLIQRQTGGQLLSDLRGLSTRNPILAFCMAACMFSLIGLPPLAGFTAKLNIMLVLAHGGAMGWFLVAVIAVNTVISLYYYARVVKVMYFESSNLSPFGTRFIGGAISIFCAVALIGMLVGFNPLLKLTSQYSQLFSPTPATAVAVGGSHSR